MTDLRFYRHFNIAKDWRWKYFSPLEIACKHCGELVVDEDALDRLEDFRKRIGVPFSPNSAYRCKKHNDAQGSNENSQHRFGKAFDIPIGKMTREQIHEVAKKCGFKGFGDYNTFVHIDTGKVRYWNKRSKNNVSS